MAPSTDLQISNAALIQFDKKSVYAGMPDEYRFERGAVEKHADSEFENASWSTNDDGSASEYELIFKFNSYSESDSILDEAALFSRKVSGESLSSLRSDASVPGIEELPHEALKLSPEALIGLLKGALAEKLRAEKKLADIELTLGSKIQRLEQENATLKEQIGALSSALDQDVTHLDTRKPEIELKTHQLDSDPAHLRSAIEELKRKLSISRDAEERLVDQISELEHEGMRRMKVVRSNFETRIQSLTEEIRKLQADNERLKGENFDIRTSLSSFVHQLKTFDGESIWDRRPHGFHHSKCFSEADILNLKA